MTGEKTSVETKKPKLGFLGLNDEARMRMEALLKAGTAEVVAVSDDNSDAVEEALSMSPKAINCPRWDSMLDMELDGVVISTPTVWHTDQALQSMKAGLPVFCQRPLGRNLTEVSSLLETSHRTNRLLTVDLPYRYLTAVERIRELILAGDLGELYAVDMRFFTALSPVEPWCHDVRSAGGGCVVDLGIHLIDALLWMTGSSVVEANAQTLRAGKRYVRGDREVEDYASAALTLESGAVANLSCAWNLHVGAPTRFELSYYGTHGAAVLKNVHGSPVNFHAEHCVATQHKVISDAPDDWLGRSLLHWVHKVATEGPFYDPEVENFMLVASVVESIYNQPVVV